MGEKLCTMSLGVDEMKRVIIGESGIIQSGIEGCESRRDYDAEWLR